VSQNRALTEKKWLGWFRPSARAIKVGDLMVSPIEISPVKRATTKRTLNTQDFWIVLSVPKACGNAVRRNRFRRIVKNFVITEMAGGSVPKNQNDHDSSKASQKAVWIRLSNRHRLNANIQIADWKASLEKALHTLL